jgi:hypothetical protein
MQLIRSTKVYSADGLCGWHNGFTGFYLVVSGVPEHVRKQQEAEQKFQEAEQQRRYQEIANLLAEMRAQNQQWSSHRARAPKFPQLDSDDLEEWCCRAEEYFAYHRTPDEYRVSLSTFHLEGPIRKMQWFQDIRWSKHVTTWDEFVRILRERFAITAELESLGNVKDEEEQLRYKIPEISEAKTDPDEEEKNDDEAKQPIVPEPDPAEGTKQIITPGPDPVADITQTKISELAPAENAYHSLISTTEPDADSYRPFVKIPQPKNSDSLVKKTHPDLKIILDAVDFVVLKHRWRWKQVANVEDAAAEAETSKCRCRRSRAGQRTGCSRGRADRPVPRHGSGGRPTSRDGRKERRRGRPCSLDESISETCQDEGETVKRRIWKQERRAEYGS